MITVTCINGNYFVLFTDENIVLPHVHDVGGKLLRPV